MGIYCLNVLELLLVILELFKFCSVKELLGKELDIFLFIEEFKENCGFVIFLNIL